MAMSDEPPMIMFIPTSSPIVHGDVPGRSKIRMLARIRSTTPLASIQDHRAES
jgi:hypothetical protein